VISLTSKGRLQVLQFIGGAVFVLFLCFMGWQLALIS